MIGISWTGFFLYFLLNKSNSTHRITTWLVNSSLNHHLIGQQLTEVTKIYIYYAWIWYSLITFLVNSHNFQIFNISKFPSLTSHDKFPEIYRKFSTPLQPYWTTTWLVNSSPNWHMVGEQLTKLIHDWSTALRTTTLLVNRSPKKHN